MKLLVAIDESDESRRALREVARRPWPSAAVFRVLNVMSADPAAPPRDVPVPSAPLSEVPAWPAGTQRTREMWHARAQRIAEAGAEILVAVGLPAEAIFRDGAAGPEIVAEARAWRADLIVLGARRHGLVHRVVVGSVASYVLQHAPCSVEVIREPDYD
jgi:nucleotide-binding universal stress UspA family protein